MDPLFSAAAQPKGPADAGADLVKNTTTATFMADVVDASMTVPVIVDFWAEWCGPCRQLGPALEKAVRAAKGKVRMVKLDIDKNPDIARQMRIQSIPAVYAFFQGRPVDGFVGAVPESQIKTFIDRLVQAAGGPDQGLEDALAEAQLRLAEGDHETAGAIFSQVLQADPENAVAYGGLARCLVAAGELDHAREMLDQAPDAVTKHKDVAAARTALQLVEESAAAGPIPELKAKVAADPADHQARFDLAMALFAAGEREGAVEALIEIVRRDRTWNDDAARKQLVKFFDAFGPTDKLTIQGRRRLSSILFS